MLRVLKICSTTLSVQDLRWDDSHELEWFQGNGPWSFRFTTWYTAGLLKRANGNDVVNARAAIRSM